MRKKGFIRRLCGYPIIKNNHYAVDYKNGYLLEIEDDKIALNRYYYQNKKIEKDNILNYSSEEFLYMLSSAHTTRAFFSIICKDAHCKFSVSEELYTDLLNYKK